MKALLHRSLRLLLGACCVALPCWIAVGPVLSASPAAPAKRWAHFELDQSESQGDLQIGRTVTLTITLGGVPNGPVPVVAQCESILFEPQTVTLEPDAESSTLKATVTLEPLPLSRTSVHPKAARIQVTFSRFRQARFERFMRRIVYVTLDHQAPSSETNELSPVRPEDPPNGDIANGDLIVVEEVQPDVAPVATGSLAEEDLMPLADPGQGKAYWQQVSHLVSQSWARQVRGVRRGPSRETVKVHFRLYPNGRAQLIQIERGSGAREIDEAGIYAVVNAQPFPPFPAELGDEVIDVHVRMRTGARVKPREVQPVTLPSDGKPEAPPPAPKK
jgi:TonB family protein